MTALVAILNNQAVALAADSAVTTPGPDGEGYKIYSTNKLFTLSKYHPVGIMVYSSAEVMTLPVETVIKVYRSRLGEKSFPTLEAYCESFEQFLLTDEVVFPQDARLAQASSVVQAVLVRLANDIMSRALGEHPGWGRPTAREVRESAKAVFSECCDRFEASPELPGSGPTVRRAIASELKEMSREFTLRFNAMYGLPLRDLKRLKELCINIIVTSETTGVFTGFAIAGYGHEEYVPQLKSFELELSVLGIHKVRNGPSHDVRADGAGIVPFAQMDMVQTFVEGKAREYDFALHSAIDEFFVGCKNAILNDPSQSANVVAACQAYDDHNAQLHAHVDDRLKTFAWNKYIGPILSNIQSMPKEELALMAEALINLTAMKRHAASAAETVAGPTDVAIISKGDGFIWKQRKHYFSPDLNLGFRSNYFRGE